jgi:hypothetical protein
MGSVLMTLPKLSSINCTHEDGGTAFIDEKRPGWIPFEWGAGTLGCGQDQGCALPCFGQTGPKM